MQTMLKKICTTNLAASANDNNHFWNLLLLKSRFAAIKLVLWSDDTFIKNYYREELKNTINKTLEVNSWPQYDLVE